jgi:hypothetical protein
MGYTNDSQAFCLANTYGFNPPLKVNPARNRTTDAGKYEPDHTPVAASRCMLLAHWFDKTNVLIKYTPADLEI